MIGLTQWFKFSISLNLQWFFSFMEYLINQFSLWALTLSPHVFLYNIVFVVWLVNYFEYVFIVFSKDLIFIFELYISSHRQVQIMCWLLFLSFEIELLREVSRHHVPINSYFNEQIFVKKFFLVIFLFSCIGLFKQ